MPRNVENPFAPPTPCKEVKSSNPKTIQNRTYASAKRGLDISDYRDDGAFRSKKYRAMKKLRACDGWVDMSPDQQRIAEETVVQKLEDERAAKKKEHEREWIRKVNNDEIGSDEDDVVMVDEEDDGNDKGSWKGLERVVANKETKVGDDESEWSTEDENSDGNEDVDGERLNSELAKIKKNASARYMATLAKWEDVARKKWLSDSYA